MLSPALLDQPLRIHFSLPSHSHFVDIYLSFSFNIHVNMYLPTLFLNHYKATLLHCLQMKTLSSVYLLILYVSIICSELLYMQLLPLQSAHPTLHPPLLGWSTTGYLGKPGDSKLWEPEYHTSSVFRGQCDI